MPGYPQDMPGGLQEAEHKWNKGWSKQCIPLVLDPRIIAAQKNVEGTTILNHFLTGRRVGDESGNRSGGGKRPVQKCAQ